MRFVGKLLKWIFLIPFLPFVVCWKFFGTWGSWEKDEDGDFVRDANGNKIFVPIDPIVRFMLTLICGLFLYGFIIKQF